MQHQNESEPEAAKEEEEENLSFTLIEWKKIKRSEQKLKAKEAKQDFRGWDVHVTYKNHKNWGHTRPSQHHCKGYHSICSPLWH